MCASYLIRKKERTRIGFISEERVDIDDYHDKLIVPRTGAPVIYRHESQVVVSEMMFSLLPSWSKEPKVKFATHNARLETISEKPTWREAFRKRHCLVPLTDFIEPIYEGDHAGFMVSFHLEDRDWLLAAGIWESWTDRQTGEVIESFAIITSDPPPFIASVGHDRCPVFLGVEDAKSWLQLSGTEPSEGIRFLKERNCADQFEVENFRPMRPGWEKRK
ncbi:MAG: SOS response-associated peptidase [Bdellovibrionales bacterium]